VGRVLEFYPIFFIFDETVFPMKAIFILILIFSFPFYSYCQSAAVQPEDRKMVQTISSFLDRGQCLEAIDQINRLISKYPGEGIFRMLKGAARMYMNDVEGARVDFLAAQQRGYISNELMNAQISKEYLVNMLLKDQGYDIKLDPLRDYKPVIEQKDVLQGSLSAERTCFDVIFYDLTVKIIPETKSIEGKNIICFRTLTNTRSVQIDLFPEYKITNIIWNDKQLNYTRNFGAIFIDFSEELIAGSQQVVVIEYNGIPRQAPKPPWNGGFVWEKVKGRHHIGVACEHLGASSWWPNKDHLSDKPDSMRINIQVPEGYQAISNGNLRSEKEAGQGYKNFEWFVSYPINNYNVTFYMGDFVNFNEKYTNSKGTYQIDYYVLPSNLKKAETYYAQTKDIIGVYEKLFGEYPFMNDGAAMVEAPFEGMEHQGAIAIGGNYGKSSRKRDYWTKDYDYLLIHETGHEWWGNAVAVGDMADAWINEGFTTYSEYLFAEEKYGYQSYVKAAALNQRYIVNLWPIVGQKGINENTFLGGDIYNKGAAMLNNLRCIMDNDTLFKKMIREYFEKYRYKITTTDDFVRHVHETTNRDYSDFFNKFLYSADPPVLKVSYIIKNKQLSFTYNWINVGKNFEMPFCIAINDKDYIRLVGTTRMQAYTHENVKSFFLPNEYRFDEKLVPRNSLTYYWTSWPF
jgi:aminopeptidase N